MNRLRARLTWLFWLVAFATQLAPALHAQSGPIPVPGSSRLQFDPRLHRHASDSGPTMVVLPPQLQVDRGGALSVVPNIELYEGSELEFAAPDYSAGQVLAPSYAGQVLAPPAGAEGAGGLEWRGSSEQLPFPREGESSELVSPPMPIFDEVLRDTCQDCQGLGHRGGGPLGVWDWLFHGKCDSGSNDRGVGYERVMNAPFEIYTTQPENNYRFRIDAAYGLEFPDRSEYYWARGGRGPIFPERSVNYQDIRMLIETGGPKFSTQIEVPIRVVDPVINANHAGLGDMFIMTKTLLLDGDRWQITQIFKTILNTGSPSMGLGTGHVSLEPGFAYRCRLNDALYLHGDTTYWFALGGNPTHSGQVLRTTAGLSMILYENDVTALIPTLEFINWTALNGQRTDPNGLLIGVDGEGMLNIHPGLRYVWDTGGDFGMFELGVSAGFSVTGHHWYESLLRADVRWAY